MQIILASQSKRRQELLKYLNIDYEIVVPINDEITDKNLSGLKNCQNISYQKAFEVMEKTKGDRIIIACDTVVVKNNEILGKPKDKEAAFKMIKLLNNTSHEVISCLTIFKIINNKLTEYRDYGICKVFIDKLTDEEINDWITNHNPYDKAGGYAIQEEFGKYITKVEGDFYSIIGLPVNKLYNILKPLIKK